MLLLLLLLTPPTDASETKKPIYMVLVPSLLHTGTPEKGCLLLSHLNETVSVSAFMESVQGNESLFSDLVVSKDLFQCVSFTVAQSLSNEVMFLTVQVKGPTHEFRKRSTVLIKNNESLIFVQTDKPIYKAGQTEPALGFYKVVMRTETGRTVEHPFSVEEFVLPKFEVKVEVPEIITILDKEINVSVCGIYTYGKPVTGHVTVNICRKYSHPSTCFGEESLAFCEKFCHQVLFIDGKGNPIPHETILIEANEANYHINATTDKNGLVQFSIDTRGVMGASLTIRAKYKDNHICYGFRWLTGENVEARYTANAVFSPSKSFVRLEPVATKLSCDTTLQVQTHYILNGEAVQELKELIFHYLIMSKGGIIRSGTHELPVVQGETKGHFSILISVDPDLAPVARLLLYIILPDGEVVADTVKYEIGDCLFNKVNMSFSTKKGLPGTRTFLSVTASPHSLCALRAVDQSVPLTKPEAELSASLVYDLLPVKDLTGFPEGADLEEEDSKDCIKKNSLYVNGILYSPVLHTNEADMYGLLKDMGLKVFTNSDIRKPKVCGQNKGGKRGYVSFIVSTEALNSQELCGNEVPKVPETGKKDTIIKSLLVEDMGLKAFTNLKIKYRKFCLSYADIYPPIAVPALAFDGVTNRGDSRTMPKVGHEDPPAADLATETIRKYFPETWIWDLVTVNSSGVTEMEVTVPDTITEWKAGALCLSNDTGLGLSPVVSLQAFKPFFVELTMPYSVIRGETFTLKATVLNYLPTCIRVGVLLEESPDFTAVPVAKDQDSHCLCANGRHTASWLVTPKSLGNVNFSVTAEAQQSPEPCGSEVATVPETGKKDTVVKVLIVEPEGIKKEHTFSSLLCASGDILSSAIKNTQNLLHMPFGCGEQNMVLFAPNIYVLKYLNETQQLTQNIKSKAIGYLTEGYQRELNYKHKDGSYSAFGDQDGQSQGNTWLTAFVLKSFAQARAFIFVDETHITHAFTWLSQQQQDNGCFRSSGSLFNNAMKGGVKDEVTLSAYITIAFLESSIPDTHPVVSKALTCLESSWKTIQQQENGKFVYTKALLAYAFALAGNQDKRNEILKSLDNEAIKEENSIHWERPQKPMQSERSLYKPQAPSAEVEMNAYVLLTLLTAQPAPTPEDLGVALQIVKWLTKQQNPHGGFSSTQDTVVALHALSKYGAVTFARSQKTPSVTIQSSGTFSRTFQIESSNRLLLQQISLPDIPGDYDISVSGEGCVYAQTTLRYNMQLEKQESAFTLRVQTLPLTCDNPEGHNSFQISLEISYTGSRPASNMVIVDVKMVSGFIPLKPTVKKLERSEHVSKTEMSNNNVLLYVDTVTNQTLTFSFVIQQDIPVRNLQPAIVKVYDYYETDEVVFAEYSAPCSSDLDCGQGHSLKNSIAKEHVAMELPRVSSSEEKVSLSVHVKGPKHEFSKTNEVMVKNQESVVFVQTDKPMYKPGQPVKFRVVSMDTNLHPLNESVSLLHMGIGGFMKRCY
ncbi:Murinoglobulin-1 [Cricetulus griseus]|uniref:Murinoglobulin-1 n=1 Tax=Cricetulus griseus TaxID=10029 RepID=G3HQ75_CRIGR|nr:Murinoglobulin-1 [Cricetulus griseus]